MKFIKYSPLLKIPHVLQLRQINSPTRHMCHKFTT